MGTKESQKHPNESIQQALNFVQSVHPKLSELNGNKVNDLEPEGSKNY